MKEVFILYVFIAFVFNAVLLFAIWELHKQCTQLSRKIGFFDAENARLKELLKYSINVYGGDEQQVEQAINGVINNRHS